MFVLLYTLLLSLNLDIDMLHVVYVYTASFNEIYLFIVAEPLIQVFVHVLLRSVPKHGAL
jgi:hypothetical protein